MKTSKSSLRKILLFSVVVGLGQGIGAAYAGGTSADLDPHERARVSILGNGPSEASGYVGACHENVAPAAHMDAHAQARAHILSQFGGAGRAAGVTAQSIAQGGGASIDPHQQAQYGHPALRAAHRHEAGAARPAACGNQLIARG